MKGVFDEIYVINLDSATERMKRMDIMLRKHGLSYKRISATDGRALTPAQLAGHTTTFAAWFATRAAIGCALSHKRVWQDIVDRGLKTALVLEDDAAFAEDNFDARFQEAWQQIPADWDLVQLGSLIGGGDRDRYSLFDWLVCAPLLLQRALRKRGAAPCSGALVPDANTGSHAYALTNKAAQELLRLTPRICSIAHNDVHFAYTAAQALHIYGIRDATLITQPTTVHDSAMVPQVSSPNLLNHAFERISLNDRDVRLSWALSEQLFQLGSPLLYVTGWRVIWFGLGMTLGLRRVWPFAGLLLVDDLLFAPHKRRGGSALTIDVGFFLLGAWLGHFFRLGKS